MTTPSSVLANPAADAAEVWGEQVSRTRAVPGQFVVRFRAGAVSTLSGDQRRDLGPGIQTIQWLRPRPVQPQGPTAGGGTSVFDHLALVIADGSEPPDRLLARLERHPTVASAEPNSILTLCGGPEGGVFPNDFRFGELWNLHNTGQNSGSAGVDIDAPGAWEFTTGSASLKVAVIDTGIDYFHPDLEANIWNNPGEIPGNGLDDDHNGFIDDLHGYDFVSDDSDPMDDQIHGTHVAGTIGAVGNNEIGVVGICWQVDLMALKAFNDRGEGSLFDVIAAVHYAIANGARILNASWGQTDKSQALEAAIGEAHRRGLIIVAAAGNNRSEVLSYPAAYPEAVTVAATNNRDQRSIFSSFGAHVDVAAPGENILSTATDNRYDLASGTSMATPHVAGVAALILSRHPEFTHTEVDDILRSTGDPLGGPEYIGASRLNAGKALRIETPLPKARLGLPGVLAGQIDLRGTAAGPRFARYTLEAGQGVYPSEWTPLHTSESPVESGPLVPGWSSAGLPEGSYVFRLTVQDTLGQQASVRTNVTVRNVHLASPLPNDVLRAGERLTLRGTVFGPGRTYTLEHGRGRFPTTWSTAGITLAQGGREQVIDGELGTWDTRDLAGDEFYTLRLSAWSGAQAVGTWTVPTVYLDRRLRPGWPQYVEAPLPYDTNDWRHLTVADLDGDGFKEIVALQAGTEEGRPAYLEVLGHDGRSKWRRELLGGLPASDIPTVGDLEGDGQAEIFVDVGDAGVVWAFRQDGEPLGGNWPVLIGAHNLGKVVADLDHDGLAELIVQGETVANATPPQRLVAVIAANGVIRQRWFGASTTRLLDVPRQFPAVGNLDDDPDLEIVAVMGENSLACFDLRRAPDPVWQATTRGAFQGSPVLGDVDGDLRSDIVVGSVDPAASGKPGTRGGIFLFDRYGQLHRNWPVLIDESFPATPALGDLDGDGAQEIVAVNWDKKTIHALRADGFEAPGWPVGPILANDGSGTGMVGWIKSMPVVGDIDGDTHPDVVLVAPGFLRQAASTGDISYFGGVKAWSFDGRQIDLHPRPELTALPMESSGGTRWKAAPPILTDLDANGRLDVVASTVEDAGYAGVGSSTIVKGRYSIYAWELDAAYSAARMPWPMFQRDPAHTGWIPSPTPPNEPPVLSSIPHQTIRTGGTFFPIELDRYVEDPDHPNSSLEWRVEGAEQLEVSLDAQRVLRIRPPHNAWVGSETLRVVVQDPGGLEAATTATFAARLDYEPPVANPDLFDTAEDRVVELDPLANDSHPGNLPLQLLQVSRAEFGAVSVLPDQRVRFRPRPDFFGDDSFTYIVVDGQDGMAMGRVTIRVAPAPDPPIAAEDRAITLEDAPVEIDVLANDTDPDGDPPILESFSQPAHGTVARADGSRLVYQPRSGWSGYDTFAYQIADREGHTTHGVVTLQVKPVNDPPAAQDLAFTLNRNMRQDLTYQAIDPDGDELTYSIGIGPEHGELWAQPTVATYYPHQGYSGPDSFTYTASDGEHTSPPATVRCTILDANNPPVAEPQSVVTKVGRSLTVALAATDPDDEALAFQIVLDPSHGWLDLQGSNAVYTPHPQYLGPDQFAFHASDAQATSAPAWISVRVTDQNTPPIAESYDVQVGMNTPTRIVLRARDGENDPLAFTVVTNPLHGSFSGTGSSRLFTPAANYYGPDRFAFTVHDGEAASEPGIVAVSVVHPNHVPQATNITLVATRDAPLTLSLPVVDADNDHLRGAILKGPKYGRITGGGTNYIYVPDPGYSGGDSFTFRVWDGTAYSSLSTVTLYVQTPPPPTPLVFEAIKRLDDGTVQMRLGSTPGQPLEVQVSADLLAWETLFTLIPSAETITFVDTNAPAWPYRFYRATRAAP